MCLKISFLCECFAADFTLKRPIIEVNPNMALRIAEPGEGFLADKAGETLAEPTTLLIHNEAALQSFFYLLGIFFVDFDITV